MGGYDLAILISLLAVQAAMPPDRPSASSPSPSPDVIVTAVRPDASAAALDACLARHCPPNQDIAATLARAESLFIAGDYQAARDTLRASVGRNRRFAAAYPVPVSYLMRANATVALHLGRGDTYRIGALDVVSALKAGLSPDDPRVLAAQIEVGDSFARVRRVDAAFDVYHAIARRARELELPTIEGHALLRAAVLAVALSDVAPERYRAVARHEISNIVDNKNPKLLDFVMAARVLQAQVATKAGNASAIDKLVDEFRSVAHGVRPVLLYSPGILFPENVLSTETNASISGADTMLRRRGGNAFDGQWVDISFWIRPDGRIADTGVLKQSPRLSGSWVSSVLKAIAARRYAPLALYPADPGLLRIERYTYTAFSSDTTGSHIGTRENDPRVEMLDLSPDSVENNP